jgi:hydroxyacylglutathione hydrolase
VHCGSGYRASIAASMIDGPDRSVVLIDQTFDRADALDLTA